MVDRDLVRRHKKLLHGSRPIILQAYPEKGDGGNGAVFSGPLKECGTQIGAMVQEGLAVGIALNEFRNGIRRADHVERINAFFVDFDGTVQPLPNCDR